VALRRQRAGICTFLCTKTANTVLTCAVMVEELSIDRRCRCEARAHGSLRLWAPAKLNLNLLVGPKGDDGFHPVDSFVAKVTLYDRIDLTQRYDGSLVMTCTGADCGPNEQNLAYLAAQMLSKRYPGAQRGVRIELHKNIPPQSGLGGASSDAAAVLYGLNLLWRLNLSEDELTQLAAELDSDVPLFLGPAAARMTGRGERIEPLEVAEFHALVYLSGLACSTRCVYDAFDRRQVEAAVQLAPQLLAGPPSAWRDRLVNQLTGAAESICGELGRLRRALGEVLGPAVCLTGSGSGLFVLFDSLDEARAAAKRVPPGFDGRFVIVRKNPW